MYEKGIDTFQLFLIRPLLHWGSFYMWIKDYRSYLHGKDNRAILVVEIKKGQAMNLTTSTVPKEVEKKILVAIDLKKQLEQYEKEIKEELLGAMKENNIVSIKNEAYTVSLTTRATYKGENKEFMKNVLDTTRVGAYVKLNGDLPKGIEKTESQFITWRAK